MIRGPVPSPRVIWLLGVFVSVLALASVGYIVVKVLQLNDSVQTLQVANTNQDATLAAQEAALREANRRLQQAGGTPVAVPETPPPAPARDGAVGAQGARGLVGPVGAPGATGPSGARGPRGLDGAPGPVGETGPAGVPGSSGSKGEKGDTGPQGPKGETGDRGPAGADGADGATGPQGPAGQIPDQTWDCPAGQYESGGDVTGGVVTPHCTDLPALLP
jgi:hypothetical protein